MQQIASTDAESAPAGLQRLAQAVITQAVSDTSASSRRRQANALKFLTTREPLATWCRLAGLSLAGIEAILDRFHGDTTARLPVTIPAQPTKPCGKCGSPIRFARKRYKAKHEWLPIEPKASVDAYSTISAVDVHQCDRG